MATTCGHIFHENCIVLWTMRSYACPECRNQPTFPLRTVYFTYQEQSNTQEMYSLELAETVEQASSSEPAATTTMSAQNTLVGSDYSQPNTVEMIEVPNSSIHPSKTIVKQSRQQSCGDGCGVCNRFHCLMEKAITLRNMIREYEKAHLSNREDPTLSETRGDGDPEAKRKRSI
uniref:RING-type domain-containing protein n=1 Tax=Anopheles culicifacies TaxID=139723 RepID=A0A182MLJ9_9DIPT